jgi:uncharacterized protein (TIGR03663 family)
MSATQRWCAIGIVALAFLARVWALDFKPAHFDEGVNGAFVDSMRTLGAYQYDPANYHGPLHFYVLFTGQQLFGRSLWVLRMPTVLAGTLLVAFLLAYRRFFPFRMVALGALFVAISPGMIFYSRYAIHEMWLPLFAAMACYGGFGLATGERRRADVWWVGMGLTGMVLTKETYLLHWVAAFLALGVVWLVSAPERHRAAAAARARPSDLFHGPEDPALSDSADAPNEPSLSITGREVASVWAVSLGILVAFYSAFGLHWDGVRGMLETFTHMHNKGTHGEEGHHKEVLYWVKLMAYYEWPALAGLLVAFFVALPRSVVVGALLVVTGGTVLVAQLLAASALPEVERKVDFLWPNLGLTPGAAIAVVTILAGTGLCFALPARDRRIQWLGLYGIASLAAYALIPYKTPWCSVNFLWPFCLVAASALHALWMPGTRLMAGLVALLFCVGSTQDSYRLNFIQPTNDALPPTSPSQPEGARYAYVQTTFDINKLLDPTRRLVRMDPRNRTLRGLVFGDAFPLIWELNDFPNIGFHELTETLESYDADFLIVPDSRRAEIEAQLVGIYFREPYDPRGGGDPSWLYLQAETFRPVLPPGREPELHPRIPLSL